MFVYSGRGHLLCRKPAANTTGPMVVPSQSPMDDLFAGIETSESTDAIRGRLQLSNRPQDLWISNVHEEIEIIVT